MTRTTPAAIPTPIPAFTPGDNAPFLEDVACGVVETAVPELLERRVLAGKEVLAAAPGPCVEAAVRYPTLSEASLYASSGADGGLKLGRSLACQATVIAGYSKTYGPSATDVVPSLILVSEDLADVQKHSVVVSPFTNFAAYL